MTIKVKIFNEEIILTNEEADHLILLADEIKKAKQNKAAGFIEGNPASMKLVDKSRNPKNSFTSNGGHPGLSVVIETDC